jgi:two-component system, NarL family, nitrate/nitrite response regulator NarL
MPPLNGLEATRQILKQVSGVKILILSAHSDDGYVEKALEFGAKGFLLKQTSAHVLSRAIREFQKGNVLLCKSIRTAQAARGNVADALVRHRIEDS